MIRARRSVLSVPGDRPRFHAKASGIPADEVLFDLEDSVAPGAKTAARLQVVNSLANLRLEGKTVAIRVNGVGSEWFNADLEAAVRCPRVDAVVVPKVNSAQEVIDVERRLSVLDRHLAIEVQIETAAGLEHAGEVAAASHLVEALHFGPFDLAASLATPMMGSSIPDEIYLHGLLRILVAARASGRQAIDGPFTQMDDAAGLERSAVRAAQLGLDGKWAIHPDQIAAINAAFTPTESNVQRARDVVASYRRATVKGHGVIAEAGEMVDEATRRWAKAMLARRKRT
jgi:citrate lyase subunit beta/citryl-CoA lyase